MRKIYIQISVLMMLFVLVSCSGNPLGFLGGSNNSGISNSVEGVSPAIQVEGMNKMQGLWYTGYKESAKLCAVRLELEQVNAQFPVVVGTGCPDEFTGLAQWKMAQNQIVFLRADNSPVVIFTMIGEKHWEGVALGSNKIVKLLR